MGEDICDPSMSFLTGAVNVCNCLGSGAGYLIVCGQVFQVATGADEATRRLFVLLVGVFVCAPLALARHVSFMRHLAAGSVAALLLLVVTVVWFLGEHGQDESVTPKTLWFGPGGATVFTYMNSINNIVFAYNNQFNVPQLTGELTPQPTVRKMTVVSVITVAVCLALFGGVSVFGVLAFGVGEGQRDSLVLDLTPERKNPLVLASLIAVMFSVLTCFQFHVYPLRQVADEVARHGQRARFRGCHHPHRGGDFEPEDDLGLHRGLCLGLHLLRCSAAVGHPDPPAAEGLCVEQRRGGGLHGLVLLGGFLFCVRHVLCDSGCAFTVARPGSRGRDGRACIHTSCSSNVRDCPWLRRAMGDPAQHGKVAIGDPSYIHTVSYSAWSHRPPRQQRSVGIQYAHRA